MGWRDRAVAVDTSSEPASGSWRSKAKPVAQEVPQEESQGFLRPSAIARSAYENLPELGAMAAGTAGSFLTTPLTAPLWAAGGAALGKATQNLLKKYVEGEDPTREDIYVGPVVDAVKGATYEMGGLATGKIIGSGVSAGKGLINKGRKVIGKFADDLGAAPGPEAQAMIESSERLGLKPTRGMLTGEPVIQKMESAVSQTPTPAGKEMSREIGDVYKGLSSQADDVLKPASQSKMQLGEAAKKHIGEGVSSKLEPAVEVYKKIESEVPHIIIHSKSASRVSKNIRSLPYAKLDGTREAAFANMVADNIDKIGASKTGSLADLRNLKSYVGKIAGDVSAPPTMRSTAGEIGAKLARMEQSSITRAAISAAKTPKYGESVAKEMIKEIKGANQVYKAVSRNLKEFAKNMGLGKVNNYSDFMRKVDAIPDEKFLGKVFDQSNVKHLRKFKAEFPKAFENMRSAYMGDVYNKSLTKGEVSIPKMLNQVKRMSPEFREMLFGKNANKTVGDIETVYNKLYSKVGPSGTPEGSQYLDFGVIQPGSWWNMLKQGVNKKLLDNPELLKSLGNKITPQKQWAAPMKMTSPEVLNRSLYQLMNSRSGQQDE